MRRAAVPASMRAMWQRAARQDLVVLDPDGSGGGRFCLQGGEISPS